MVLFKCIQWFLKNESIDNRNQHRFTNIIMEIPRAETCQLKKKSRYLAKPRKIILLTIWRKWRLGKNMVKVKSKSCKWQNSKPGFSDDSVSTYGDESTASWWLLSSALPVWWFIKNLVHMLIQFPSTTKMAVHGKQEKIIPEKNLKSFCGGKNQRFK